MQTDESKALKALNFARSHDWGREAVLRCVDGVYSIDHLDEAWTFREPDGSVSYHVTNARVDATIAALREFGNY